MIQTYSEIAKGLRAQLEIKRWPDCDRCRRPFAERYAFTDAALGLGGGGEPPNHEALADAVRRADMGIDHAYRFTAGALDAIAEAEPGDEDELYGVEVEPPCYTSVLVDFMAADDRNASFLQQALEVYGVPGTGRWTDLLALAHYAAQREVLDSVQGLVRGIREAQERAGE
jgi:hypothetical protein